MGVGMINGQQMGQMPGKNQFGNDMGGLMMG